MSEILKLLEDITPEILAAKEAKKDPVTHDSLLDVLSKAKSKRLDVETKWRDIQRYYGNDPWGQLSTKMSNKAFDSVNLIKQYTSQSVSSLLMLRMVFELVSWDNELMDEIKLINKWIKAEYYTRHREYKYAVTDAIRYNWGIIKIVATTEGITVKRKNPFSIWKEGEYLIEGIEKGKYEIWTRDYKYTIDDADPAAYKADKNPYGLIPFEILQFEIPESLEEIRYYTDDKADYQDHNVYGASTCFEILTHNRAINKTKTERLTTLCNIANPPKALQPYSDVEESQIENMGPGDVIRMNLNEVQPLINENNNAYNFLSREIESDKQDYYDTIGAADEAAAVRAYGFRATQNLSGATLTMLLQSGSRGVQMRAIEYTAFLKSIAKKMILIIRESDGQAVFRNAEERTKYNLDFSKLKDFDIEINVVSNPALMPPEQITTILNSPQYAELLPAELKTEVMLAAVGNILPSSVEKLYAFIQDKQRESEAQKAQMIEMQKAAMMQAQTQGQNQPQMPPVPPQILAAMQAQMNQPKPA